MRKKYLIFSFVINLLLIFSIILLHHIPFTGMISYFLFNKSIYEMYGEEEKAELSLLTAIQINPRNYQAHCLLGSLYYSLSEYPKAVDALNKCLEFNPYSNERLLLLGESYEEINEYELAANQYEKILLFDDTNQEALNKLAKALKEIGVNDKYFITLYRLALLTSGEERKSHVSNMLQIPVTDVQHLDIVPGTPVGFGKQTSAAIDLNDRIYLLSDSKNYPGLISIYSSIDLGKSWELLAPVYVSTNIDGSIDIDDTGSIHVVFGDRSGPLYYANSRSNFESIIYIADKADARQIAVDSTGMVHLVWTDEKSQILYTKVDQLSKTSAIEIVTSGSYPSLTIFRDNPIISFNSNVSFPDPEGGVFVTEKHNGKWQTENKVSIGGIWSGASAITTTNDGSLGIVYISNQNSSSPSYVFATQNILGEWINRTFPNSYPPFIPENFGGKTSPGIMNIDDDIYFVFKSGDVDFPIVWIKYNLSDRTFGDYHVLDYSSDSAYKTSPSFLAFQRLNGGSCILWTNNDILSLYCYYQAP